MLGRLLSIRADERVAATSALAFLTALVASHSVLETARDALFLARLPATRLPLVYLAIAALSLIASRVQARGNLPARPARALVLWTCVAAAGTFGLWWLLSHAPAGAPPRVPAGAFAELSLYALYVWSGVVAAIVLVQFWSFLAEAFSITQAKRLYPTIGAGSVVGALLGSALATSLAQRVAPDRLLLIAALGFAASAVLGVLLGRSGLVPPAGASTELRSAARAAADDAPLADAARLALRQPYVRRVAALALVSAACLTLVDYAFKSSVAAHVPARELGAFFAGTALVFNVLSLVCQLGLAPWLLRRAQLGVALAVLPSLLVLGAAGLAVGMGLAAALLLKGTDGALRYSLHRTATELLYVPLPDRSRTRIKALLDVVGPRLGQALASLAILTASGIGLPPVLLSLSVLALALAWVALALYLRGPFVELLRANVRAGLAPHAGAFPRLDVASLETLVAALDSANDAEVLAALDVLEREGKTRLVPALILHHPSEAVVEHALALFARAGRSSVLHVVDRLLEHSSIRVRCAALATRSLLSPDARLLYQRLSLEESPEVRATIVVHLIASHELVGSEASERLQEIVERGHASARIALAGAIASRREPALDAFLLPLAAAPEIEVRLAALRAMAQSPSPAYLPALVAALDDERTRPAARAALVAGGEEALTVVRAALRARATPIAVRWELPRTLALFRPQLAADALLAQLVIEDDGMVRYRSLRALESLIAKHPTVHLARGTLDRVIAQTVSLAFAQLDARLTLEAGARAEPRRRTAGFELLQRVLLDKEEHARDRLLRLLGLAHPYADFARIRRGLRSTAPKARASCVELVGNLLRPPLRTAVVALIDDQPDDERLAAAGSFHVPEPRDYEALLEHMLASESEAVQDFTAFHVGELGLSRFRPAIAAAAAADPGRADMVRALAQLDSSTAQGVAC
jgi:AAA family ATP:ADP antiporter